MTKKIYFLTIVAIAIMSFSSCKDEKATDPPTVKTTAVTSVAETSATSGGEVTSEGSSAVTVRGVCWGIAANPTIADSKTSDGTGIGIFTSNLTGLTAETVYHLRAYATNSEGTAYGADVTFSTFSLIKTQSIVTDPNTERNDFFYDATTKRITKIDNFWNNVLDKTITYDWSVAGKLTYKKGTSTPVLYDVTDKNMVIKDYRSAVLWYTYEYDANGYLVKYKKVDAGVTFLKMEAIITDGNIMKHTTYADDGITVSRIKEFTYSAVDNVNGHHQASMVDSNTLPVRNLFGKPSKKLVSSLKYWDPRVTPIEVKTTVITYVLDSKNWPTKITRTGADFVEVYNFTYY